ncbi:hypothetical protein P171DRAFT_435350 [Karstenula rhodostoma CBS 690.94]|uniref:Tim44-like domain-containing protein n=1 Tax=Karstenula rhodostoma CBS 690.94 TaxID=1392251 RepID=A0A9P4U8U9_9PLEO|nr:hypothetical protein P171DRAFT_435350 [Karstenula rhodostoma CBS 690.94]
MSTHLPLRSLKPLHRQCLAFPPSKRFLSSTPALERNLSRAGRSRAVDPVVVGAASRYQPGKASSSQQEEQFSDERNVPDDIGLVPGTFVHAPLFPLTRFSLKDRMSYEWKWLRARLTSWYQLWRFRRSFTENPPHMYWLSLKNRKTLSQDAVLKYKALYESFANADSKAISTMCASGVAQEFQTRIESRPAGVRMQWNVQGEPSCKIVSNVASPLSLPGFEDTGLHQVVFRIQSKQTLRFGESKESRKKKDQDSAATSSDIVEYFVLQKQFIRGSAKGWKVWGFTDFATPKSIEETEEYAKQVNAYQAT